ncbi:unnamed protein product [Thelazia callipaeda]|uniref:SERPIN domain-containing protein n=1 Tax=Thelazia callipaeda TaxID=103827 RepID=A0A0N5CSQ4_THECL|nr:unnamed protein product [Thelazia callipaeda]
MHAEIIFDTPFLYMVVSKSEAGRLFLISMGRFTNIQETNPPDNSVSSNQPSTSKINKIIKRNILDDLNVSENSSNVDEPLVAMKV